MKQCPICKTTYTDESLRFCLADGASLFSLNNDPETLQMPVERNPLRVDIRKDVERTTLSSVKPQNQTKRKIILPIIIIGVVGFLFLIVSGVAVILFLNSYGKTETAVVTNNQNQVVTPSPISNNQNNELKEKFAALEKQIQEQKTQKKNSDTPPPSPPQSNPPQNNPAAPTARVAPSNDGFLSLRTEPSVKTGTQLLKIPSGSIVTLENCEKSYLTVDGRRGRWCMVSFNGEIGWVFDAWLIY